MRLRAFATWALLALSLAGCGAASTLLEPEASAAELPAVPGLSVPGLRDEVLAPALMAHARAKAQGETPSDLLTVIDFSRPSTEKRLWVLDVGTGEVLFHELVAHGRNTGDLMATRFSNVPESRQSSLGLFRAAETYHGKHGLSLRLDGLEPGFNDKARERDIVIHGADYVADGREMLGRSWGCPALRREVSASVIERIRDGSLVFAWYPDPAWLEGSRWLSAP